jgi:hypothetical protein
MLMQFKPPQVAPCPVSTLLLFGVVVQDEAGGSNPPVLDEPKHSKFDPFPPEVSHILTRAATFCYLLRSLTYVLRLILATLALTNGLLAKQRGKGGPFCQNLPTSYMECYNTISTGQDPNASPTKNCWFTYPLFAAVLTYYSLMILIAVFYLALIEAWGWWWQLVSMRQQLQQLDKECLLTTYRHGDVPDANTSESHATILSYSHDCAMRYSYYLYFKCDDLSVSWMLNNKRTWREGPGRNDIVLPWPWVEAAHWVFGPAAEQQGGSVRLKALVGKAGHVLLLVLVQPVLSMLLMWLGLLRVLPEAWCSLPPRDEHG